MRRFVTILTVLVLTALTVSFAGALQGLGDSLAVFRAGLAALALVLVFATGWPRRVRWAAMAACLLAAGSVAWHKLPLAPPGPVIVYQKNMFHRNGELGGLAGDILAAAPDIVTLQEVSVENEALLAHLRDAYPTQHLCRYDSRSGIAVLTRLKPAGAAFCSERLGLAGLRVHAGDGPAWALSLHLTWPYPLDQAGQVSRLTAELDRLDAQMIIGGDFNMVPWSHTLARIARISGTHRAGPSRPTFLLGVLPLPIDHVFAPGGGRADLRPLLGGDHRGLLARVHLASR